MMTGKSGASPSRTSAASGRVKPKRYVALLRGINVGGRNIIKMVDLKACFEDLGFADVATYIQSGNVVFQADEARPADIVAELEGALSTRFGYDSRVILFSSAQMKRIVERAPPAFGTLPDEFKYDVIFLRDPLTPVEAMKSISLNAEVDVAFKGPGVLYFSRRTAKLTQSRLSKLVGLPVYQQMTIRNWNTTSKLLAILEQ